MKHSVSNGSNTNKRRELIEFDIILKRETKERCFAIDLLSTEIDKFQAQQVNRNDNAFITPWVYEVIKNFRVRNP